MSDAGQRETAGMCAAAMQAQDGDGATKRSPRLHLAIRKTRDQRADAAWIFRSGRLQRLGLRLDAIDAFQDFMDGGKIAPIGKVREISIRLESAIVKVRQTHARFEILRRPLRITN
jgi:hypothetical protein